MSEKWGKESKITDLKGNLRTAYHGTFSDFKQFEYKKSCPGPLGLGFYFTSQKSDAAENYSNEIKFRKLLGESHSLPGPGRIMSVQLDIRNPLIIGGKDTTKFSIDGSIQKFIGAFEKAHLDYPLVPIEGVRYMSDTRFRKEVISSKNGFITAENIVCLVYSQLGLNRSMLSDSMDKKQMLQRAFEIMGFDGVVFNDVVKRYATKMTGITRGAQHYVAFNPEQINLLGSEINEYSLGSKAQNEKSEIDKDFDSNFYI